ncbi:MAG: glycosyltransferase family 2 protein [Elusimicrobia bacterium]|nr:glycosyltransferase family 2 protein [Elusimicrobiota bacterium]
MLSVVGPVYNESASIAEFHSRLVAVLRGMGIPYEIVYVNDGSQDSTLDRLREFSRQDPCVRVLDFSRNFGHQLAITAGMDHAEGSACVIMDTDGQDPPELIPRLYESWRAGHEIVYCVRTKREGETWFKKATAALFYRIIRRITNVDIPPDTGDFRLVDRRVLDVLSDMREVHRFMRGLTCWTGFKHARVEYSRAGRLAGTTHYPFWKMVRFALDGITAFSHAPLRWVTFCGLGASVISAVIGVWVLYVKIFNDQAVRGWTSLMVLVLFMGGMNLIAMGVIGEYLARIFDEVKRRPLYIVRERIGFGDARGGSDPAARRELLRR